MSGDFMNQSNLLEAWDALTQLDFWVDINLWSCPNNGTADYVFPCTHWLETNTGRVSQGAGGIFGAGQRCVEPIGDVVFDPTFVVCLHKSMGVPFNDRDPEYDEWLNLDYHDFIQAGGSVGYEEQEYRVLKDATDWWKTEEYPDGPDFPQYAAKFQEEGWFDCRKWHPERWGTYRRWEMGYRRQQAGYNLYAAVDEKCAFGTPTGKVEIWSTICESYIGDTVTESACSRRRAPRPRWGRRPRTSPRCARQTATRTPATFRISISSRIGSSRRTPASRRPSGTTPTWWMARPTTATTT